MTSSKNRKVLVSLVLVLVMLLLMGSTIQAAPPASASCFYYTVRWGDTLSSIAWRFGDNIWNLAARNGIVNINYIRAGQVLYVCSVYPAPAPSPAYHVVRWGETLWSIARLYGTTPWAIAALNGIYNLNLIYAGQVLRVR